ncbi:arsenate reductase (thioredoxin) [Weissella diestrammenae]|uniref:Arsenate reductase (Thioredoxin) n=1 Tax=Weissella diestrammenae TaxID=1162633 RepID=A0A7G9T6E5_9LACO|nr:arsenate reductase (thioredoxin) [Weissella diestrammenae]MCM0583283.1 arsenate reductase (thioredoxin) [Weissella diestrammenae]QNN75670.1 arsenate reductase (thioredoxin) [Weissella diestrammenae]
MQLYFLCTGNACRSQMAEGFAKKYAPSDWHIKSAGVEQHGLNPIAVTVMAEAGIDISANTSDLIDNHFLASSQYVITLCGDAKDKCPMTPTSVSRYHWPLADPAQATGSNDEIQNVFRTTRDEIKTLVYQLIQDITTPS